MGHINTNFQKNGYQAPAAEVTGEELDMLRSVCTQLLNEPPEDGAEGNHKIGLGRRRQFLVHRHPDFPELEEFLLHGTAAKVATNLLGGKAYLFNEQFVVKGPNTGAAFAWHQDGAYVGFDHKNYLTVWIALDDANEENGCVYILPRNLDENPELDPHEWLDDSSELNGYFGDEPGEPVVVPAGSVVGFSSVTLHRSGSNVTDKPRRAYVCQFSPEPIIDPSTGAPKRFAKEVSVA